MKEKKNAHLIVIGMVLIVVSIAGLLLATSPSESISIQKANELMRQGAILLDLNDPETYNTSHLTNATNIPWYGCWSCLEEHLDTTKTYILYGYESNTAYEIMKELGYKVYRIW